MPYLIVLNVSNCEKNVDLTFDNFLANRPVTQKSKVFYLCLITMIHLVIADMTIGAKDICK